MRGTNSQSSLWMRIEVVSAEMVNVVEMEICTRVLYDIKMIVRHEG